MIKAYRLFVKCLPTLLGLSWVCVDHQVLNKLSLFFVMDFPRHVDRISMELPILYFNISKSGSKQFLTLKAPRKKCI